MTWSPSTGSDSQVRVARTAWQPGAHRNALDEPRPFSDQFATYFDRFEQVLDAVLERFETNYFEICGRLEELLAILSPGPDHAEMLL
ncbi:MAG TPA: hypothetical protein VHJ18_25845 [Streptosporangiaceae bacterium]|nr:hypothetical protein [Streptosporangiaceae bacterium]